ncbi:MAG: class I SAM-dependent methyltransferase [Maritimibacter sp.]
MARILNDDLCVTTDKSAQRSDVALAARVAADLGALCVVRNGRSIAYHLTKTHKSAALVVAQGVITLSLNTKSYGFHPNMAARRIRAPQDSFAIAADLKPGDHVLDLTCGMGADAIIAAHYVGTKGRVDALEASAVLAWIVSQGLAHYDTKEPLRSAMRRINLRHMHARDALENMADSSVDVVVLDPMFPHARRGADGLSLVRAFALHELPDAGLIDQAKRVARKNVVMSDSATGARLAALGFARVTQNRTKCWGRIEVSA